MNATTRSSSKSCLLLLIDARAILPEEHRLKHEYPPAPPGKFLLRVDIVFSPPPLDDAEAEGEYESEYESYESGDDEELLVEEVFYNEETSTFRDAPQHIAVITPAGENSDETLDIATPLQTFENLRSRNRAGTGTGTGTGASSSSSSSSRKRKSPEEPAKDPRPTKVQSK